MDGGFDFYRERLPVAKKEHKCDCCFETINPGEQYSRETGKYDGDFFDRVLCIPCHNMLIDYCNNVDNEFTWDAVQEYVEETFCDYCKKKRKVKCIGNVFKCKVARRHYGKQK